MEWLGYGLKARCAGQGADISPNRLPGCWYRLSESATTTIGKSNSPYCELAIDEIMIPVFADWGQPL